MIAAPPLAGRQVELRAVLDAIASGSASAGALVIGEAGIGKSRLVAEVAAAADVPFVVGWCLRTSSGLPFLPVVDILRGLNRMHDGRDLVAAVDRCPAFVREELGLLLPELGAVAVDNSLPSAGWRRHRLFDSVRRTLEAFAEETSVVLVIEDLHWADSSTVEMCDYLLASGQRTPVPMVLTCRADETDSGTLETIMNRSSLTRIDLEPLTRSQTRDQLVTLVGDQITERQVDEVYRRAGGNAFFTEQLASAGGDRPGAPLPVGLRAVLLGRIRDAEPDERTVLAVLAMSERPMTEVELARARGWTEQRVRDGLRGLVERRLVNSDRHGYTLRHALLGEAVSARLLTSERAELHGALGELLAERGDASLAAATANHFLGAQRPTDELRWRVRAATYAETVLAPIEAQAHWQRVIALWDVVDGPTELTELQLSEVCLQAAHAANLAGQRVEAQQFANQALTSCDTSASAWHRARIFRMLGGLYFPFALDRATAALREASRLYETLPPHREQAWTLQELAQTLFRQAEGAPSTSAAYPELEALLRRTLEIADRCEAPGAALKTRAILAYLTATSGNPRSALVQIDEMLAVGPDPGDPERTAGAYGWATSLLCFGLAQFGRTVEVGQAALAWTADHGYPTSLEVNMVGGNTLIALRELGRIDEAVALEARLRIEKHSPETEITDVWALVDQTLLACELGRIDDALELWKRTERTLRTVGATPFTGSLFTSGVEVLLWAGDPKQAARLALDSLPVRVDSDESRECGNAFSLGMRAAADLAVRGRLLADPHLAHAAQDVADQLNALLPRCRLDPFDQPAVPGTSRCDRLNWFAERTRLAGDSDADAWDAAAAGWERLGAPVRAAYARYRQGEARLAVPGGRRETATILRRAVGLAGQHAPVIAAITELARRAQLDLDEPSDSTPPARASTPPRLAVLTAREMAVLREVGTGKTNAEIGAALFMSPKTASVHVSNILRKLGFRSRVQAAALAAESGILAQEDQPRP